MPRVAIVTGGTRGIGRAISEMLKDQGLTVVANYAGNEEKARAFTAETGIRAYKWDVGDHEACIEGCRQVESEVGPVDVLVNNAGITRDGTLLKMSFEDWDAVMRVNLGVSRGYQNFAKATPAPAISRSLSEAGIPDLAEFQPSPGARPDESRFAARIAVEEEAKTGAAPRTMDSRSDQAVDVAGSYRLTRNLDVTAGVRYSQERDRLAPLADPAKQDSQAVYVGTQFRF